MTSPDQAASVEAESRSPNVGVWEAIRRAGSQRALARLLGVSQARVSQYLHGQPPTIRKALLIEQKLGVPRDLTRPDVFGGAGRRDRPLKAQRSGTRPPARPRALVFRVDT